MSSEGRCIISRLEKEKFRKKKIQMGKKRWFPFGKKDNPLTTDDMILKMTDKCINDYQCIFRKFERKMDYDKNYLKVVERNMNDDTYILKVENKPTKLCIMNDNYVHVGGKSKKSKKHRQSRKIKSRKSKKSINRRKSKKSINRRKSKKSINRRKFSKKR